MNKNYDVVIVGTGVAGCFAALNLDSSLSVLMITKDALENSDSYLAQGGISVLRNAEDYASYYEDTMRAGRYENNPESVRIMIQESQNMIQELVKYGVEFDRESTGELAYTREGAHSTYRILHHKDVTGKEITTKLLQAVKDRSNIEVYEYTTMIELLVDGEQCNGVVIQDSSGEVMEVLSGSVILATGGIGGLFKNSTNFAHIKGDSFALALLHNITMENLNYIQIHPTVLYSKKKGRRFLISESVRGEGAILLNQEGKRFVDELLPRDVVTKAIREEMKKTSADHVYLSLENMKKTEIQKRFPNIYKQCLEEGYDMVQDYIPVVPAQHYIMGGIKVNTNSKTSKQNLYAVGETACNGVHGANRLASNSLLESLVFSKRAAEEISKQGKRRLISCSEDYVKEINSLNIKNQEVRENKFKKIILEEIKRRDEEFYDQWCNDVCKC